MEVISEIWRRATSVQPTPRPEIIAASAVIALALVIMPVTWPPTRMIITIAHEGAHALAAVLTGRRLRGIRLHTDTSGLTLSQGPRRGPGMVITVMAGYLGPALLGLIAVLLLNSGHSLGLLWLLMILVVLMLLQIRNFYGFVVLVVALAAMIAISWYLTAQMQSTIAYVITWILLVAAPKPVLELIRQRRQDGSRHSDADQLARLTRIPGGAWTAFFLLANTLGLILGITWLLPGVAALLTASFSG